MKVHPTAIVSNNTDIAEDVEMGPYSIIEDGVCIGPGSKISAHVYIHKGTTIGKGCKVHTGAALGDDPQDVAYKGGATYLKIGDRNIFREYVTVHRGTKEGSSTIIGDDNFIMALAHIAHNCKIGNKVTICNNSLLAGYVIVEDGAFISGSCVVHQFVRIGKLAFIAGGSALTKDLPPFMTVDGVNTVASFNIVGLERTGFDSETRAAIKEAYRIIYRSGLNLTHALEEIEKTERIREVKHLVEFIRSSERGICSSYPKRRIDT